MDVYVDGVSGDFISSLRHNFICLPFRHALQSALFTAYRRAVHGIRNGGDMTQADFAALSTSKGRCHY